MAYLFFQTWIWLLIAFILGLLAGGLVCWLCCKKKQQENNELRQKLTALSAAGSNSHEAKATHLSGDIPNSNVASKAVTEEFEPEVLSMVETMVETVIQADDKPAEVVEETVSEVKHVAEPVVNKGHSSDHVQQDAVQETTEAAAISAFFTEPPAEIDDLKKIKGIGAVLQKVLNELGVYQFKQIAEFSDKDIAWVNESLSFPGRIEREQWVDQAKKLAQGQATEFSKRVEKGDVEY